jgi:hypothetical protein
MSNPNDELSKAPIAGYRELSEIEVNVINKIKAHAELTREIMEAIDSGNTVGLMETAEFNEYKRWTAIARTHLQQGFMAWVRAIAQPRTF